ncbi:unnamed protein product [Ceratitis capitata]|uniref:(Mediterranean fruit fly) hypothetical protein n=1 Tax=Ceratitis capitata TaxID=7213 RepID=A0A811VJ38_CERCA|nr:unnamed protein product [Ceratitis capitata]
MIFSRRTQKSRKLNRKSRSLTQTLHIYICIRRAKTIRTYSENRIVGKVKVKIDFLNSTQQQNRVSRVNFKNCAFNNQKRLHKIRKIRNSNILSTHTNVITLHSNSIYI